MNDIEHSRVIPDDFPVSIVEFTESGIIEYATTAFYKLFFENVSTDPFRAQAPLENLLPALSGAIATGKVTENDRREFGRVDYFVPWDDHSLSFDKVFKLGYPRFKDLEEGTPEYNIARDEPYKDERYFRFWTKERSSPGASGEKVLIAAVIELTKSEQQRREMIEVETSFTEKLSSILIDNRLKEQNAFELRSRPKSGDRRASGDFFLFWGMENSNKFVPRLGPKYYPSWSSRYVVAVIGDSSEKELLAAAAVQQAATILVPFCKSAPASFFGEENPAEFLIKKLNAEFISTRVIGQDRIDGAVLVFDLATRVLHFAGGGPGGVLLANRETGEIKTLVDGLDESFGPSIGKAMDTDFVVGSTKPLSTDIVIVGFTDGVRFRLSRENFGGEGDLTLKEQIAIVIEDAFESPEIHPTENKSKNEVESADANVVRDSILVQIVTLLSPERATSERSDDELIVAISVENLLNLELK